MMLYRQNLLCIHLSTASTDSQDLSWSMVQNGRTYFGHLAQRPTHAEEAKCTLGPNFRILGWNSKTKVVGTAAQKAAG
jgi:hypothetical protein